MFLRDKRQNRERHELLALMLLAQSGDDKVIKREFDEFERDS
jgi:hypothetical protein